MNTTVISNLPVKPEEYRKEVYERIDWSDVDSEMSDGQRRFISGLIQYYKPEKVLELGVSAGGGTIVLLNSLIENGNGTLYSIDHAEQFYRNPDLPVGHCAMDRYSELLSEKWHLLTGRDAACVMEEIDEKFDFCVIDTLHSHPVETLNFISILPWLNDGAIVVMHDTSAFEWRLPFTFLRMLAPRLLLSAVCAEKYIPDLPSGNMKVSNIAAWQISEDTRKYCQNLFDVLYLPWEVMIPQNTCQSIGKVVRRYYPAKVFKYYEEAVRINYSMFFAKEYGVLKFEDYYEKLEKNTIFYGAGEQMRGFLVRLELCGLEFDFEIWDKAADKIQSINGYEVKAPESGKRTQNNQIMIVTIESKDIFKEIYEQFEPLGYIVFHGLEQYILACQDEKK